MSKNPAHPPNSIAQKVIHGFQTVKAKAEEYTRVYELRTHYPIVYEEKPFKVFVEPTNFCNLKCIMCPHFDGLTRPKGYMDFGFFKDLINQLADWGVPQAPLFFGGESFLHKEIYDMIRYARDHGLYTIIHSNSLLLDQTASEKILEAGLDELSFSIDGLEKQSYEKFRNPGKFERAISCVRTFLAAKQKAGAKHPKTLIQCVLLDETPLEVLHERARSAFGDLPFDELMFRLPHSFAGNIPHERIQNAPKNVDVLIEYTYDYSPCPQPWNRMIVGWAGDTYPCCQDLNGRLVVGDAKKETLKAIWNGAPMQELRRSFVDGTYKKYPLCANCEVPFSSPPFKHSWKRQGKYVAAKLLKHLPVPSAALSID
jgi:radical SAM protein with 4Fe4S-binding SPASM domain